MVRNALTIAGSDSGGGAGIQADLKTFSALGVYGASVITALTAQNTREVRAIHDVAAGFVGEQIDAVLDDIKIDVVKIGMLSQPQVIEAVASALERHRVERVVLDPVMVAKSGDRLLQAEAVAALRERLVPLSSVITPNLPEAGVLVGEAPPGDERAMREVGARLLGLGAPWVLLKGGHLPGPQSVDYLFHGAEHWRLTSPRIETRNTHGTGCTLSSAVAAFIARGEAVPEAVQAAKSYVSEALRGADKLDVGRGHGPVNHFYALWRGRVDGEGPGR